MKEYQYVVEAYFDKILNKEYVPIPEFVESFRECIELTGHGSKESRVGHAESIIDRSVYNRLLFDKNFRKSFSVARENYKLKQEEKRKLAKEIQHRLAHHFNNKNFPNSAAGDTLKLVNKYFNT